MSDAISQRVVLAYFDTYRNEIVEMAGADRIPAVGGSVTFAEGENKGTWHICGVKKVEGEIHDALVFLDHCDEWGKL